MNLEFPRTIRARISLLTAGLSLAVLVVFGAFLYASLRIQLYRSIDTQLRIQADQLMKQIENENGQPWFGLRGTTSLHRFADTQARLVTPSGKVQDQLGNEFIPPVDGQQYSGSKFLTVRFMEVEEEGEREFDAFRILTLPIYDEGIVISYLQVGRNLETVDEALMRLLTLLILTGVVLVGIAAVGGYWLTGQALAPIEKIRRQAASINASDLGQRLTVIDPQDEVGRLTLTFNELLGRLERSFFQQRRFTADASHELRTPLAVIQGEVDVALDRPRVQAEYIETLESVGAEAQRMSRLVNELLLLASADADELRLDVEPLDLAELLELLVGQMQNQAQEAGCTIIVSTPASLPMWGDRDRLLQLFINIIENAIHYCPGSRVEVSAETLGEMIQVAISDTGPGIPEGHLPHLFDRFYRVDQVRGRSRNGSSGLGLAIAQEIAHKHYGQISVKSKPGKGTTFLILLPKKPEAAS